MIFILHYILFNAGLSATVILMALYLQTYSDASLTEIGSLLMVLPFVSIFVKPLFCALADRQQAHRCYMIGALFLTAAGYGSLAVAPFFPDFIKSHGRLVWYLDIVGVVIGFSAFGVVWSLGDALSVNAARKKGVSWGFYRVWGTLSWGVFGMVVGLINETPLLPKYVPAFLLLIGSLLLEILFWAVWPASAFDMNDEIQDSGSNNNQDAADYLENDEKQGHHTMDTFNESGSHAINDFNWPANRSLTGTLNGGSARMNPRLMSALAGMMMEDLGSTLKSSLSRSGHPQSQTKQRTALAEVLEQHHMHVNPPVVAAAARSPLQTRQSALAAQRSPSLANWSMASRGNMKQSPLNVQHSIGGASPKIVSNSRLRKASLVLTRLNSLSTSTAIIDDHLQQGHEFASTPLGQRKYQTQYQPQQQMMLMSSLASNASITDSASILAQHQPISVIKESTALDGTNNFGHHENNKASMGLELSTPKSKAAEAGDQGSIKKTADESAKSMEQEVEKYVQDLQMLLLKLIVKRNHGIFKYLIMFTLFGVLFSVHLSYFFMNVEELCRHRGEDFSTVMGCLVVAQSVSEIFCFIVVVPYYMPRVGRLGSLLSCSLIFAIRYAFYGTYFAQLSPYSAIATETAHGLAYAMIYSLITDYASDCVEELDDYLPELVARGLVDPKINPNQLKLPLRATMQGVFSGAFDGLGFGLGALFAGVYLDSYSFSGLWLICAYISAAVTLIYPLTELRICRPRAT